MNKKNIVTKIDLVASKLEAANQDFLVLGIDLGLSACALKFAAADAETAYGKAVVEAEIARLDEAAENLAKAGIALGEAIYGARLASKNIKLFGE